MLTKLLTVKMAAAAAAAVLGGGAAAAATGALPTPLQTGVSHGLSTVGISVPDPGGSSSGQTGSVTSTAPSQAVGPAATGPAMKGLCTAYAASSGSQAVGHSVAFRNLLTAASAAKETVAQYCTGPPAPATTSTTKGSSHAPANHGRSATAGSSQDATGAATGAGEQTGTSVPPTTGDQAGAGSANDTGNHGGTTHVQPTASDHAGAGGQHGNSGHQSTSADG